MIRTMRSPKAAAVLLGIVLGAAPFYARGELVSLLKTKYDSAIRLAALKNGLDPVLVHAVIRAESAYNRWSVSTAGAQGLMQLMPETGAFYGVSDPFDPESNIAGGTRYLKDLSALYPGRTDLILAAYNAGQSAVAKYGGVPPYAETRDYIAKVQTDYIRGLARGKTRIFTFIDAAGRRIMTNDPRLALSRSRRP
jgi:soluble lytic murein transglycosylase-like protein